MKARRWIGATLAPLLLVGALAGCASNTPAPQRYTLPAVDTQDAAGAEASHQLLLPTPRLADYLDVDGIVMQTDDITLVEAQSHQWAEALGRQLQRGLRDRLANRLPRTRVLLEDTDTRRAEALRLELEIDRFHGHHDGRAVIGGQWRLYAANGDLVAMRGLNLDSTLDADGYPALVRSLGRGWDSAADELAAAIRRVRRSGVAQ
ncbi:PqiC family protein [Halomonas halodenitrificans]|uniref:PqiC family protein n=1 Tax=Halomonas halodenitrificans TaxID=28252 RepID=UPI000489E3F8|nr:ABC-type transport auxiliary lipoprotein family protein [Halomonas halodenitrificans]